MKRRGNEQWQELFAQQEASGVSAAEFCKQHDLCPKYFSLRRKQLAKVAGEMETGFVRVNIKPDVKYDTSSTMTNSLVIHSNAGRLDFGVLPPASWLAQLLRTLA